MHDRAYRDEADNCRALSEEFHEKPEGPFLLSVANVYDELADELAIETQ